MRRADLWGVPALLGLAMLANAAMVPLVPYALATRLGWPLWLVGIYSFAVMVVTMVVNHFLSRVVDTVTRRSRLCIVCGAFQAVGALAAIAALTGIEWFLALTVVGTAVGGAAAPIYYTLGRLIAGVRDRDSGQVNSVLRVITSAAWVVGPAISFAAVGSFGITSAFAVIASMAAIGLVAVLIVARWLDERSAQGEELVAGALAGAAATRSSFTQRVLPHLSAFAVVFMFSFAHLATATSLPLLLVRRFEVAESATGLFLGLKAGVEMIAILLTPLLMRRWGVRATLTLAGGGALVAYGSYLLGSDWAGAIVGSVWEGAYYGIFAATALTWIQSLPGMRLGQSTGFYMNGIYAGVLIGAPVSGLVASYDLSGILVLSLTAAVCAVVALQWAFGIARRRRIEADPTG